MAETTWRRSIDLYSKSYRIRLGELATLYERVLELARRVRETCREKLATFGGADALRSPLPEPPALDEPLLANMPPPPDKPAAIAGWARDVAELAEAGVREGLLRVRIEGVRKGEARGKAEGVREGEARGKAEGKAEGLREGKTAALLTVLAARGLAVDAAARARLEACADLARLDRWLARALTVASAREALDDAS
jgi:hypothetical protein